MQMHSLGLLAGLTTDLLKVVLQLGTAATLWLDNVGLPLESRLPWQLFSELLISSLLLPLKETPPFNSADLGFPVDIPCNEVLIRALGLLVSMTGSFLKQANQPDRHHALHFQHWIMPIISTQFQGHYNDPTSGGVAAVLMAVSVGQPCMRHLQLEPMGEEAVCQGESCHEACCKPMPAELALGSVWPLRCVNWCHKSRLCCCLPIHMYQMGASRFLMHSS